MNEDSSTIQLCVSGCDVCQIGFIFCKLEKEKHKKSVL